MMAKIVDSGIWWILVAAVAVAGLLLLRRPRRLRRGGRLGPRVATTDLAGRRQVRTRVERDAGFASVVERPGRVDPRGCVLPPAGWWCSRPARHEGPCAARPAPHDHDPIECWCELTAEDAPRGGGR